jgi:hypothetical protein
MSKNTELNYEYPIYSNYYDDEINKYCLVHDIKILQHHRDKGIVRYIAPIKELRGLHQRFFNDYTFAVLIFRDSKWGKEEENV